MQSSEIREFQQTSAAEDFLTFLARVLLTIVFFASVPAHFGPVDLGFAKAAGVPLANIVVPATGILQLIGAISVLLGYKTKLGAWLLILFLAPVTLVMHQFWSVSDPMLRQLQQGMFIRNLAIIGGLLIVSQFGGGAWSLDGRQGYTAK
jgi:putative oxidoreductase